MLILTVSALFLLSAPHLPCSVLSPFTKNCLSVPVFCFPSQSTVRLWIQHCRSSIRSGCSRQMKHPYQFWGQRPTVVHHGAEGLSTCVLTITSNASWLGSSRSAGTLGSTPKWASSAS